MILLIIGNAQLKQLEKFMSDWLDKFRAALEKVATGKAEDEETKAAVAEVKARLEDNEAADADRSAAIMELTEKLAASTPAAPAETGSGDEGSAG